MQIHPLGESAGVEDLPSTQRGLPSSEDRLHSRINREDVQGNSNLQISPKDKAKLLISFYLNSMSMNLLIRTIPKVEMLLLAYGVISESYLMITFAIIELFLILIKFKRIFNSKKLKKRREKLYHCLTNIGIMDNLSIFFASLLMIFQNYVAVVFRSFIIITLLLPWTYSSLLSFFHQSSVICC